MKAIVLNGEADEPFVEMTDMPLPRLKSPTDVLIRSLAVGLDGTDREIITEKYGVYPEGETKLVIGHEVSGVIVEAGAKSGFVAGDLVTVLVRRPCGDSRCVNCRMGQQDFCQTGKYVERGIKGAHGYLCEYFAEDARYVVGVPASCAPFAVLIEPQSIVEKVWNQVMRIQQRLVWEPKAALIIGSGPLGIMTALTCRSLGLDVFVWSKSNANSRSAEIIRKCGAHYEQAASESLVGYAAKVNQRFDMIWECSGYSPFVFEAMGELNNNGVLAVLGVTSGNKRINIAADSLNQEVVLKNKCIIGSVNASRTDFETAMRRLPEVEKKFPGLLVSLLEERFSMSEVPQIDFKQIALKAVVDVAQPNERPSFMNRKQG